MSLIHLAIPLTLTGIVATAMHMAQHPKGPAQPLHVRNTFEFTLPAPQNRVAPLFGAEGERAWGGEDWDPHFIYPQPAQDKSGAVFQLTHDHQQATWITTLFDPKTGHMQYVYFVPDSLVTLIDIHLSPLGASGTRVEVAYERTALNSDLNEHVRKLGEADTKYGPEWKTDIEHYLAKAQ